MGTQTTGLARSRNAALLTLRAADAAYVATDDETALRLYAEAAFQARSLGDLDLATMAAAAIARIRGRK